MSHKLYCSFCGKCQDEIDFLLSGPAVFICNECVWACVEFLKQLQEDLEKEMTTYATI